MKLTATLLVLASAATQHAQHAAASQNHAVVQDSAPATQTQDATGYAQQETPQEYGGDFAAPEAYAAPVQDFCVTPCPVHAPCLHQATGSCVAKSYFQPMYQPYGYHQEPVYGQGAAQQQGYRRLSEGTCPPGTVDSDNLTVTKRWPLWTGFALLFVPALWFMYKSLNEMYDRTTYDALATDERKKSYLNRALKPMVAGFICMIASLAYLTMATNHGFIARCCDGRSFYYARYIDWAITTPLMLFELTALAEAAANKKFTLEFVFLLFVDVLMVVAGLIGALMCANAKWFFFGFSMLCFLPILHQLYTFGSLEAADVHDTKYNKIYKNAMWLTVILWSFYPIVWILAEGTDILSANGEAVAYTVLDIIAKSVFGFTIVSSLPKWV